MAFAVTKVECYGLEAEEAVNKRYRQYMNLTITNLAADVDLDLGDLVAGSLGTFWTAVSGTTVGANALKAIQDIVTRAASFDSFGSNISGKIQALAAAADEYTVTIANKAPNILFDTADAPVGMVLTLKWVLKPGHPPVEYYGSV
jgi:hypothetical protein